MAGSRFEKLGTIFSRTSGLLRSGVIKEMDKPLWYDVYAAFPPKLEPRYDRPVPTNPINHIFYKEDKVRARFYKTFSSPGSIDMINNKTKSLSQRFVEKYQQLENSDTYENEEQIFQAVVDYMNGLGVNLVPLQEPQATRPKICNIEPLELEATTSIAK